METNKILTADVLDIIFDGRNKTYGAYVLRKTYNKRLFFSLLLMISFCFAFFLSMSISNNSSKKKSEPILAKDIDLENIKTEITPPIIPQKQKIVPPANTKTEKFVTTRIVKDVEIKQTDRPPTTDELEHTAIGAIKQNGTHDENIVPLPNTSTGGITDLNPPTKDLEVVYTKVEIPASFPGGVAAWKRYLEKTLDAQSVVDAGAPTGLYTIQVKFIVDKNGNISNVEALNDIKYGMTEQAIKVIKNGPQWTPAIQNGMKVNYQAIQRISFNIESQE